MSLFKKFKLIFLLISTVGSAFLLAYLFIYKDLDLWVRILFSIIYELIYIILYSYIINDLG
jgi:hypothetical protein